MAEMGKLIAEARRSAGIRQEDLAQAVGVTVNAV
jgi:transcriptional regulator with XRE-family HTH domain